jgi:hydroxymethylbilane synthase
MRQTELTLDALRNALGDVELEVVEVTTQGDRRRDVPIASLGEGVFVKALETALLENEIDVAVHSAKDVPVEGETPQLVLAAFPPRADARDALLTSRGERLDTLPSGAIVATGSPRRVAQTLARRPDLTTIGIRGNVDTRIRKLRAGEFDALMVAAAGLERLGLLEQASELLETDVVTPAAGQGALAVQCRASDAQVRALLAHIDHLPTRQAVLAERQVLRSLGGGCRVPVGAYAERVGSDVRLRGVLATPDGVRVVTASLSGAASEPEQLGRRVAQQLAADAADLLAEPVSG